MTSRLPWSALLAAVLCTIGCAEPHPDAQASRFEYATSVSTSCADAPRGRAGRSTDFEFADGYSATVIAPLNYRADVAHPLLVVYPAARQGAAASEQFTHLTRAATAAGFVVAYAAGRRLNPRTLRTLNTLPTAVAADWCIDSERVVALGHSDGGTTALAGLLLDGIAARPDAVVSSAAGIGAPDLDAFACPAAVPVLLLGKTDDKLFPGYARDVADWLGRCYGCAPPAAVSAGSEAVCRDWTQCSNLSALRYCEVAGGHATWPDMNTEIMTFIKRDW